MGSIAVPSASAQTAPSPADKETARKLVTRGNDKLQAGDYAAALEAFQGADAIMGVPTTGLGVGRSLILLGRLVEARDKLLRVERIPAPEGEPAPFAAARLEAKSLADDLGRRIPSVTVTISGPPADTAIALTVDGHAVPPQTMGLPRSVDPGEHTIAATAPGYADAQTTITVREAEQAQVELRLLPGGESDAPETESDPSEVMVWAGFSAAGAGAIVGAIVGGLSLSSAAKAEEGCDANNNCPATNQSHADQADALAHGATASFVIAGVGAVVGLVGVVLAPGDAVSVTPEADGAELGLSLVGRF